MLHVLPGWLNRENTPEPSNLWSPQVWHSTLSTMLGRCRLSTPLLLIHQLSSLSMQTLLR